MYRPRPLDKEKVQAVPFISLHHDTAGADPGFRSGVCVCGGGGGGRGGQVQERGRTRLPPAREVGERMFPIGVWGGAPAALQIMHF